MRQLLNAAELPGLGLVVTLWSRARSPEQAKPRWDSRSIAQSHGVCRPWYHCWVAKPRKTGRKAASAAGKTLRSKNASKTAKRAAASDLAQVGNSRVTSRRAASAAGKTLASKKTSKAAKRAAASDLAQRRR